MAIDAAAGLTGGCQCGAVRYRLSAEPTGVNICHCRMCQKASGGPMMAFGGVRLSEFFVSSGAIATFSSSDIAERGFCARCGTPLTYRDVGKRPDQRHARQPRRTGSGRAGHAAWRRIASDWLVASLSLPEIRTDQWLAKKKIADIHNHQHPDHET